MQSSPSLKLIRTSRYGEHLGSFQQHYLLVHNIRRESAIILDFERRRPASRVIAAQHTRIDQEDLATKATP